jgi:hypothetical protein
LILENIIQEHSLFGWSILLGHFTEAMLNSVHPFAFEYASIFPDHFALSLALILVVLAFINISTNPLESTMPMLQVI